MHSTEPNQVPCDQSNCALNRRSFLRSVAAGMGVVILGGCAASEKAESETGSASRTVKAVAVGGEWKIPGAEKLQPGQALAFELPVAVPALVFVTKDNRLGAISAKCTHAGCTVLWENSSELRCPCHGSRFDLSGKVLSGPAQKPLPLLAARRQADEVLIKL